MKTKPLKIADIVLDNNVLAAPLAGVTDAGFRSVCKIYGAALTYTEMISAKGLISGNKKTQKLLFTTAYEKPCAVQIFGSESAVMAEACKSGYLDKFDIIDINMGCPVPKVTRNKEGAALMGDVKLARSIITACVKAAKKPVTVKFRKGINQNNITAVEFAKMCEGSGASLITVHGRLKSQLYGGKSDRDIIKCVVQSVSIPVIANGDVFCDDDAVSLIDYTGAEGVMVARGCLGNPQIFADITNTKKTLTKKEAIMLHAQILKDYMGENIACLNMRKHMMWYLKNTEGGKIYKRQAANINAFSDIEYIVNQAF